MRTPPMSPVTVSGSSKQTEQTHASTAAKGKPATSIAGSSNWQNKEGNIYLDEAETQIGIETARTKETVRTKPPSRPPSRLSKLSTANTHNNETVSKTESRPASRLALNVEDKNGKQKDTTPATVPSKTIKQSSKQGSVIDVKVNSNNKESGSRKTASISEKKQDEPSKEEKTQVKNDSATFLTETDDKNERVSRVSSRQSILKPVNVNQSRDQINASSMDMKQTVGRRQSQTSVVSNIGRTQPIKATEESIPNPVKRDPTPQRVIKNETPPKKQTDTTSNLTAAQSHIPKKESVNIANGPSKPVSFVGDQNVHNPHVKNQTTAPKPKKSENRQQEKKSAPEKNDLLTTQKAQYHEKNENQQTKPKPSKNKKVIARAPAKGENKKNESKKAESQKPDNKNSKTVVTRDVKVDINEYERKGRQSRKRSTSGSRKRSGSRGKGGRKRSTSRGRQSKRSTSREKKASLKFPDVHKKDNKWEITLNNTRTPSPKPKTENQWKNLVEKYIRQPSPKIGKSDDRSLLDSNLDDDDDDGMDIFKRASKRYNLSLSGGRTDDEDDDDSDV